MAYSDYGVVVKKNGKIINKDVFIPMAETIGVSYKKSRDGYPIDGEYFIFIGDKDFYIGIYKGMLSVYSKNEKICVIGDLNHYAIKGTKYSYETTVNGVKLAIKRVGEGHRYILRFHYKNDFYEALYGYGVGFKKDTCYSLHKKMLPFLTD